MNHNKTTELVFILDRSGSMSGLEEDTIGGFNSLIKKNRKQEGKCLVSTVLFDDRSEVLHDRVLLEEVEPMNDKDYYVRGSTALLDAIGGAIHHIETIHKYAREEDVPKHTMFVITTDGMENSSHEYSYKEIKKKIQHKKNKNGWEFIFLGANMDAVKTAGQFGIEAERAVNYKADKKGTKVLYNTVSESVCFMRATGAMPADWGKNITEDYVQRS